MGYKVFSGSQFSLYYADVGTTATAITAATGVITPDSTEWTEIGTGLFAQDFVLNNQDVRQEIMTAGGRGMPDGERRTVRGLLVTGGLYDMSLESYEIAWGNDISETAAGSDQVGVLKLNLDLSLEVEEYAVEIILTSQYGEGSDELLGHIYLPKASIMLGEMSGATTVAPVPFTVKQLIHTNDGFIEMVSGPATS